MILLLLCSSLSLILGFCLDLCLGDPLWLPHPVRWIGRLISGTETLLRRILPATPAGQRAGGILQTILVAGCSCGISLGILWLCWRIHPLLFLGVQSIFCYQILATKSLKTESTKVAVKLKQQDLPGARYAVSRIVGRDTQQMTEEEVAKATVETIAENTSDGIVAPMLFLALGGAPLGFLYKAVNTMDSMVGYRNDRYRYFGTAAAKTDDVLNWIPARVSAWLMILAAQVLGYDGKQAKRIYLRDRRNHASPNSAHTEAACAGALHIQLGGDAYYFGKLHQKPTIGDAERPITYACISAANRLLYGTATAALLLCSSTAASILLPLWFCL